MNKKNLLLACALASALPWSATAAIQVYDDKAAFLTDTGASTATGALPTVANPPASIVAGTVTVQGSVAGTLLVVGLSHIDGWGTDLLAGNEITVQGGPENLDYILAAPVFSLGFDFAEPNVLSGCGGSCVDSTFSVTLLNSGAVVDSFTFNAPDAVAAFVGVWSDNAFDRIEIRETIGSWESEFFGEVFTGNLSPVPEPHASAMLLAGLGVVGWRARRGRA